MAASGLIHHGTLLSNKKGLNAITWMDLNGIMLTERSQFQKVIYCKIPLYNILEIQNYKNGNSSGGQGLGGGYYCDRVAPGEIFVVME